MRHCGGKRSNFCPPGGSQNPKVETSALTAMGHSCWGPQVGQVGKDPAVVRVVDVQFHEDAADVFGNGHLGVRRR
jgi:hypothetical protein